ncbi:MAG: metal-dependent transcriptional regulator [Armatimonadetes bacterium]|nr:metal-dependent transcriptional regulator [Armatimonadota bacterium]
MNVNPTTEDYLRSLYKLESRDLKATNAALAKELNVTSAAVTDMLRKLDELGLVSYQKYKGVTLTKSGLAIATRITRRHRLWEVFLIQHLRFAWDEVHDLANQLEHIRSDELTDRLDEFLGYPQHDPHGDPIPTRDGVIPVRILTPIGQLQPGEEGAVQRVSDEFPELLRYAVMVGLSLGSHIKVMERIQFDGSVRLVADGRESVISAKLAESVFVQLATAPAKKKAGGKK